MGKNWREWCDFHRVSGHSTEDCWTLGAQLEGLIQQGRLGHYVARTGRGKTGPSEEPSRRQTKRASRRSDRSRSPRSAPTLYRGTISAISGGEMSYDYQNNGMRRDVCQLFEAQDVLTGANLTPLGRRRSGPSITFQDKDMGWRMANRDEPMVISVVAADFKIERVLIDQGSSANILYGSTYRQIGLSGLKETPGCLYGFSGEQYPVSDGVGSVWADSHMARKCYEDSLRMGQCVSTVNALSLELDPRGHDERERPRLTEELKEVQIGPKEIHKTKIDTVMSKEQETNLIHCLQQNHDVFAWSLEDMPRIDLSFMCHRLSVLPEARPIM
ncbi:hypothetical protein CR513_54442, partial [Mucuna pruriens]